MNIDLSQLQHSLILSLIVLIILFISRFLIEIFINKIYLDHLGRRIRTRPRVHKRMKTLVAVENNLTLTIALIIIAFIILKNFVNITPLLASAGIIGLAVSLGAQSLIKDALTGFFFLVQDQFSVGDIVNVGTITGKVTDITLRTVTVRDIGGNVTTFSNSSISQITNLTKEWSVFDMTLAFPSSRKVDDAIHIMQKAGSIIEHDQAIKSLIVDKTTILGIETMDKENYSIRVNIKTQPGKQFEVGRAYRYQLKKLLEEGTPQNTEEVSSS